MEMLTLEEHKEVMDYIESRLNTLFKHETNVCNKEFAQTRISFGNGIKFKSKQREYYVFYNNTFLKVVRCFYPKAMRLYPENFGTNNAKDILEVLFHVSDAKQWIWDINEFEYHISTETFCLALFKENGIMSDHVLRFDLFRKLDKSESETNDERLEFTGGLFHALKHFSIKGQPASIYPNQNCSLNNIEDLVTYSIKAFFLKVNYPRLTKAKKAL